MYPLIGNVLHAQKMFFIHISVLTEWNRNVDKIYYMHYVTKQPGAALSISKLSDQHISMWPYSSSN